MTAPIDKYFVLIDQVGEGFEVFETVDQKLALEQAKSNGGARKIRVIYGVEYEVKLILAVKEEK